MHQCIYASINHFQGTSMNILSPVYTLQNECRDCYRCVRECYVKAIRIKDDSASVISGKCIACGACVRACPSGAKRVRQDIEQAKNLIKSGKKVFVSLAPSWAGIFDYSPCAIVSVFKKLGFEGVSETALGAQEVSVETAKILKDSKEELFISGACPVVVDYIRLYKPKFTKNIAPIASPALTHAKMLKELYGDDISVVFAGPCIAKKNEAKKHPELIDAALTFEELKLWINEESADLGINENSSASFVPEPSYEGALYPLEGGMNDTIKMSGAASDVQFISLSSLPSIERALKGFKPSGKKIFLEALACSGGCVNGPCIAAKKSGIAITSEILSKVKKRKEIPLSAKVVANENYAPEPLEYKLYSLPELTKAMKKIGKHSQEDELNCGGCGYATCRDLAAALISGDAEPSMCVSYMRKIAMRKADAMFRCMPAGIVIVNDDLNIVEANDSFMKMFCRDKESYEVFSSRPDGLAGAAIDKIVSFPEIFKQALETGKDIHKEHFGVKNKMYDITAFTIEENEIVGAIITDVTLSETNREKIAQKAREVITKNVATVQEIACLLGEHMVETELLLNSIAQDYDKQ
jgi:iron only hydrogenase large subunit-like protein